jgi:hypothetical protein
MLAGLGAVRYAEPMARRVHDSVDDEFENRREKAGLCADCTYSRLIRSDRPSEFYLCAMHAANPYFAKYPRLPVTRCTGYEAKGLLS